ncbi:MAG: hypothetical protein HY681_10730 [Chloroflexi bacterium]|nr:hypothetical protein [Chloroflexota bacterium]
MKKRFSSLILFGLTAALLALIGVVTALAAPSAAVNGTITLDKSWYTNSGAGAAVKVTVTDADFNVAANKTDLNVNIGPIAPGGASGNIILGFNPIVGIPQVVFTSTGAAFPNVDVTVVSANLGIIQVISSVAQPNPTIVNIKYQTSAVDTVPVKVVSTQNPTGIVVNATETGNSTGIFVANITLVNAATTTTGSLFALDTNTVTAGFTDTPATGSNTFRSVSSSVETGKPTFSGLTPANKVKTQTLRPTFSGTIADVGGSGIKVNTVAIMIDLNSNGSVLDAGETFAPTVTGADGASTVTFSFTPSADLSEGAHVWQLTTGDVAGNTGTSDSDTASTAPGNDPQQLAIDNTRPSIAAVMTGRFWDTSLAVAAEGKNKATSLVVNFNEELDPASVTAADFTVDGVAPTDASVFSSTTDATVAMRAYLTLASALAANAKPVVAIAVGGGVADKAGNVASSSNTSSATAADFIAPTFTVTLDKTIVKANENLTVSISSSEPISGVPVVSVMRFDAGFTSTPTVVVKSATTWESVFQAGAGSPFDSADSSKKSTVRVNGTDAANNAGAKGANDPASTSAITFILDGGAPAITKVEAGGKDITAGTVDVPSTSPFVTATYNEKESITKVEFGEKGTTLVDVAGKAQLSTDGKIVIYAATGLTVGKSYQLKVSVKDQAGNELKDQTKEFKAIEKAKTKVPLAPGQNLVSLPSDPADMAINSVITSADVKSVVTYDPLNPDPTSGPWKSATRGADGKLSGSLATIDSMHAYWVNTSSFAPIEVAIPEPGFLATPPSIAAAAGWNMMPVVSLIGQAPGATIPADQYFASLPNWVTAYTFNPATNAWTKITPKNFQNVVVGQGYWLYTTTAGILVP